MIESLFKNIIHNARRFPDVADALIAGKDVQMRLRKDVWSEYSEWKTFSVHQIRMDATPEHVEYRKVPHVVAPSKLWINVRMNKKFPHVIHSYSHLTEEEALDFARRQNTETYKMVVTARCMHTDKEYSQ